MIVECARDGQVVAGIAAEFGQVGDAPELPHLLEPDEVRLALGDLCRERREALLRAVGRDLPQRRDDGVIEAFGADGADQRRDVRTEILVLRHHLDVGRRGRAGGTEERGGQEHQRDASHGIPLRQFLY